MEHAHQQEKLDGLLTLKEVEKLITLSCSSIYRLIRAGKFPPQLHLGPNRVAWRHSDIARWLSDR